MRHSVAEEFIDQDAALEADGALDPRRVERDHQRLDRRRREYDDLDAERIAAELRERHMNQQARAYSGDDENLPQSMLVPSVEDPKLWQIRAKVRFACLDPIAIAPLLNSCF